MNHFFLPRFSLLRHYSIFCLCKYKFLLHVLLFFILCFIFLWLVWWYIVRQWWYWYFNFRVMNLSFFLSCSIYLYFFIETDIIRPRTRKPHNPNPSKPKDENGQRRVSIYQPRFGMDEHFEPESAHTRPMSTPFPQQNQTKIPYQPLEHEFKLQISKLSAKLRLKTRT
jgi:hypothetical protein